MSAEEAGKGPGAGIVLPVDGPAGSGKSTMARRIADLLGWDYLETGALYRAVGLGVLEAGENPDPEKALRHAQNLDFVCRREPGEEGRWRNVLAGRDVTDLLREERVSDAASRVSSLPGVRASLLGFQRRFGRERGAVLDGRDIGTVVFPEARLKFFLDAGIEVRIERRFAELRERGIEFDPKSLGEDIRRRDRRDREREVSPLRPAEDAELIDTTHLDVDRVLSIMLEKIRSVYGELIELR